MGILLNSNFTYKVVEYKNIVDGRLQSLKLLINDKEYTILNVYGQNNDKVDFLNTLEKYIIDNNSDTFIIGGDFNTVIDVKKDKKNGNPKNSKNKIDKINTIIENNDIHDIWRILNPDTCHYTWHSNHKPPIFSRLDYFLVSSNILNSITKCKISVGIRSDHSLVYFNINTESKVRGPGYFKINNSILLENEYQNIIKKSITEIAEINKNSNPNTIWELIKGTIRNETIRYT